MTEPELKSPKSMFDSLSKQALEFLERSTCSQKSAEYRGGSQLYREGGTQLSGRSEVVLFV